MNGTGIILVAPADPLKRAWLVTAKHVFEDGDWSPEQLSLRFSWFDKQSFDDYLGIPIPLKVNGVRKWIPHPVAGVDLAAVQLDFSREKAGRGSIQAFPLEGFATVDDVYEGATVFVYGYPGAAGPEFLTRGIVRSGIVAWVDPANALENRLLIDATLFPGNSGGPVLRLPVGITRTGNMSVAGKVAFLGIVSKGPQQLGSVYRVELNKEKKRVERVQTNLEYREMIGLGVVEPASRVLSS